MCFAGPIIIIIIVILMAAAGELLEMDANDDDEYDWRTVQDLL